MFKRFFSNVLGEGKTTEQNAFKTFGDNDPNILGSTCSTDILSLDEEDSTEEQNDSILLSPKSLTDDDQTPAKTLGDKNPKNLVNTFSTDILSFDEEDNTTLFNDEEKQNDSFLLLPESLTDDDQTSSWQGGIVIGSAFWRLFRQINRIENRSNKYKIENEEDQFKIENEEDQSNFDVLSADNGKSEGNNLLRRNQQKSISSDPDSNATSNTIPPNLNNICILENLLDGQEGEIEMIEKELDKTMQMNRILRQQNTAPNEVVEQKVKVLEPLLMKSKANEVLIHGHFQKYIPNRNRRIIELTDRINEFCPSIHKLEEEIHTMGRQLKKQRRKGKQIDCAIKRIVQEIEIYGTHETEEQATARKKSPNGD